MNFDALFDDFKNQDHSNIEKDQKLLELCQILISNKSDEDQIILDIQKSLEDGAKFGVQDRSGLRAIDLVIKFIHSETAGKVIDLMVEAGLAEDFLKSANHGELSPMMAACFHGNIHAVQKLLELGMPVDSKENCPSLGLVDGTPFHATVSGYRAGMNDQYSAIICELLGVNPEGLEIKDSSGTAPIDILMMRSLSTGNRDFMISICEYGVSLDGTSETSAKSILKDLAIKSKDDSLLALITATEAKKTVRELTAEFSQPPKP